MSLVRHTAYNLVGSLAPGFVSIVTVPLYLRIIGIERYGLLTICWTLVGFMGFLSLGMGPAVAQRLAIERESSDETRSATFWSAALLSAAMALVGGLVLWMFGDLYFRTVNISEADLGVEMTRSLPWLALAFCVSLASGVSNGALQGRQWFAAMNVIGIGTAVATAVVPLAAAVLVGPQLPVLLIAIFLVYISSLVVQVAVCSRAVPLARPAASVEVMRKLFTYGGWMTLISLLAPVTMLSDRLVIGSRLGSAAVPVYVVPYNLVSRIIALPASLSSASLPKLAGAPVEEEQALLTLGLRMLLTTLMPLCVAGNLIMGVFLHLWVGDVIAAQGTIVGCILVFGFWMPGVGHIPSTVIQARGRPDIVAKLLLVYVIPYFTSLFAALHWFGIVGAAGVWAIRSSMDFWLFKWAPVPRREAAQVALCSAIVFTSSTAAVLLDWRKLTFWIVLSGLLILSGIVAASVAPPTARERFKQFLACRPTGRIE
jgi:O-antigen/teichoic acid export membrane protein